MQFKEEDFGEVERVSEIVKYVDHIDRISVDTLNDEIYKSQPFIISLILGYRLDFNEKEFEEIVKVLLIIWKYFKYTEKIPWEKITEEDFERLQQRNIQMLKYLDGEKLPEEKSVTISADLGNLKSKALLAGIFLRFDTNKTLVKMNINKKGMFVIGMKSLIECFEELDNV
jgi:hypothetical protein